MKLRYLKAVIGVCFCLAASASAGDWSEFRGANGRGISAEQGLPIEWSSTKNVAWKSAIPGTGWSSPVISQGTIYLTTAIRDGYAAAAAGTKVNIHDDLATGDYQLCTLALDAKTGKTLWQVPVFQQSARSDAKIHQKNSHASPTPVVHGNRVYVHFGHQGTACLDLNGNILWKNSDLSYPPVHGNGGSPVLVSGALIFSCDGATDPFVVALESTTGEIRWKVPRPANAEKKFSFSTPAVIEVGGQTQVVSPGSDVVSSYDPESGRELWRVHYDGYSVIPQPAFAHGMVYISTGYNTPELLAIRADGKGDVTDTHIAWRVKRGAPNTPTPVIVGTELYMVSDRGVASCLDAKSGQTHWQKRLGGDFSASPLAADGKVYFQNEEGTGFVVPTGTDAPAPTANKLGERSLASYAIAEGSLFIRTEAQLYRIDAATVD